METKEAVVKKKYEDMNSKEKVLELVAMIEEELDLREIKTSCTDPRHITCIDCALQEIKNNVRLL